MPRSVTDGLLPYFTPDLEYVNRKLNWNPLPRDREATQQLWWDDRETPSSSARQSRKKLHRESISLESARRYAEENAKLLVRHPLGRDILDNEAPGTDALNPKFWLARAVYYKLEYDRIQEEYPDHLSGSVTPEVINSDILCRSEVERAMCEAGNVARMLVRYPVGKIFLEAENTGSSNSYRGNWWDSMKNRQEGLNTEDYRDLIMDPDYWWKKKSIYSAQLDKEMDRTKMERAKRAAASKALELTTFPAGKALLKAESHEHSMEDPQYWLSKRDYYVMEYQKLEQNFWEEWKHKHLTLREGTLQAQKCSARKTRARKTARRKDTCDTAIFKNGRERGKVIDRSPNHNSAEGIASERRQSKRKHRQQIMSAKERKCLLLPASPSIFPSQSTGYATPISDAYITRSFGVKKLSVDPTARKSQRVMDENLQWENTKPYLHDHDAYVTPSSPNLLPAKAQQCKVRQKRTQDKHIICVHPRASSPIASRLRSSKRAPRGENLCESC